MKFLTFFTKSHSYLYEKYFLPSIKKSIGSPHIITYECGDQYCQSSTYHQKGWARTQAEKLKFVVDTCKVSNEGEILVFCDADIIFFKDFRADIAKRLDGYDMVCQRSYSKDLIQTINNKLVKHSMCSGFYAFRNNVKMRVFLDTVQKSIISDNNADQYYFNLYKDMINFDILPDSYPNTGFFTMGKVYDNNEIGLDKLSTINLLHCNWTINYNEKVKLMDKVYNTYYE